LASVSTIALAAAEGSVTYNLDIPAESLSDALQALALASGHRLLYSSKVVNGKRSSGVRGEFTAEEAIRQLLIGTGLKYEVTADGLVMIRAEGSLAPLSMLTSDGGVEANHSEDGAQGESLRGRLHLAQADQAASAETTSVEKENREQGSQKESLILQEVVVTAQKKSERLLDVPVPVSVLSGDTLASEDQLSIADFAPTVPGLLAAPVNFGEQQLAIRGITTSGYSLPTVAVTIDGVPYGGLIDVPDIDPADLARVEVLRGPQGTLYGASSIGGLLNYVTKEPSLSAFSASLQTGTDTVANGTGMGYQLRGSANLPLSDTVALRVSGYSYTDPGYINNPILNLRGVNRTDAYGARAAILFQPADSFSLKFSALYDHIDHLGSSEVNMPTAGFPWTQGLAGLQQNYPTGVGGQRDETKAYSLTLNWKVFGIDIVSLTGYNDVYDPTIFDYRFALQSVSQAHFGVDGADAYEYTRYKKITEELRFSGSLWGSLDWLAGGFYAHTKLYGDFAVDAADPNTGNVAGLDWLLIYPRIYQEASGFLNFTYHFTDRFDVQLGGRLSNNREHDEPELSSGPFVGPTPSISPVRSSNDNAFTYLFTPRYRLSNDVMVYARLASGFRPGGPNQAGAGIPPAYAPDKTENYEVGAKGDLFDRRLSIDTSVYYINWKNIQLQKFAANGLAFTANGSGAKSEGVELSLTLRPANGLAISGWYAFDNAVLTQAFPVGSPLYGVAGDRLPLSSRNSGNLSIQQDFPIDQITTGFLSLTEIMVGDRVGVFTTTAARQDLPGYASTDIRAGVIRDGWKWTLYANNLTNKQGLTNGGTGYLLPYAYIYIRPRTVGLTITKSF